MTTPRIYTLLATGIYLSFFTSDRAVAACSLNQPVSGQQVLCDASAPNPVSTGIVSTTGALGVTVNIVQDSILNIIGSEAISLGDNSSIANDGLITGTTGILLREGSSVVDNRGGIRGTSGAGLLFNGSGNNQLLNSGTIAGSAGSSAVIFGAGDDTLTLTGGLIDGDIIQGDGVDKAIISAGSITGNLSQGNGTDDFFMSGGTLGALQQGDNRDTFTMTGGTIIGAFEDGDVAKMTGGQIGRVDMKLDNNIFDMSGGEIIGNLVTGFGNDTIIIGGDSIIGGNVSVSGGTDIVTVTGGTIRGEVRMSTGEDIFRWEGGTILSSVLMDTDNDRIEFTNLNATFAATAPLIDGGSGDDTLVMDNSEYVHSDANILQGIEHINLTNNSILTLNDRALPLGDALDDNASTGFVIDATSTLAIQNNNATAFNSHVSGTGTISTNTGGNTFDFTTNNVSDNFAGTLALGNSTFDLSGLNTRAINQATLKSGADSVTTVGAGMQHIGGLVFDGGTVDFGRVAPGNTLSDNSVQTAGDLNLNGSGTVRVGIDNMINEYPVAAGDLSLLAQDDTNTVIKLAGSDGTVTGNGGSLTLTDANGNVITDSVTESILQNGDVVAQGTWDWRLTSGQKKDGLYIAYALKELNLQTTGDNALLLNSAGATGNAADLSAKVTGSGDLAFESSGSRTVSLSNQDNDYTGVTDVRSGNVLMNNNHVLGKTSLLQMADGTGLDMNGYAQTIGSVSTAEYSQIDIGGGSLTVAQGGTVNGHLMGAGSLTLNTGTLDINGENASLSASTQIRNAATINLNNALGLGTGGIDNAGLLNLNATSGTLFNSLSNNGAVDLNNSQIVLAGDNSAFSGTFDIDSGSQLTAYEAKHLGRAAINDSGALNLLTNNNWTLINSVTGVGNLVKDGVGVVTLTQASAAYTGRTDINAGGIAFGSRGEPLKLATSQININAGFLAGNGTVAGDVNNQALMQVGNRDFITADAVQVVSLLAAVPAVDTLTINGNVTNGGQIQVGPMGSSMVAGNVLTVKGDYLGNDGNIAFNTALGNDNSITDRLFIEGDSSGTTHVSVNNAGGRGARTLNGIELISITGTSSGEFLQEGRIVAGAYDYRLVRGAGDNQKNWYLTNDADNPPSGNVLYRPEAGSYITNLAAANTMFSIRLHDRLGETQYTDALSGENKVTSLWLRQVGTHNRWRSDIGSLKTSSNQYVVMLGGDVAQWSSSGLDRGHVGLMAGYGNNKSNTRSDLSGNASKSQVSGYSAGVYGTWYANDAEKTGFYLDTWAQYNWFKNTVSGEGLSEEKYDSQGVSASLESGYTWQIGEFYTRQQNLNTIYIQPKAQVTWMGVKADDHTESNGTPITSDGGENIQTRLGTRVFLKGHSRLDNGKNREFEPFVEANWLHNTHRYRTTMNGIRIHQDGARNIGELKAGVEGLLSRNLTTWGNVGQQIGDKGYGNTEAMLGVKYSW